MAPGTSPSLETLPEFWKAFKDVKGKSSTEIRTYLEGYDQTHASGGYFCDIVWSNYLITAFKTVTFYDQPLWERRLYGITPFSIANQEHIAGSLALREQVSFYELSEGVATPEDRRKASLLNAQIQARIPQSREELRELLNNCIGFLIKFFSVHCPLVAPLTTLHHRLQNFRLMAPYAQAYGLILWRLFLAFNKFFDGTDPTAGMVTTLLHQIQRQEDIPRAGVPLQLVPRAAPVLPFPPVAPSPWPKPPPLYPTGPSPPIRGPAATNSAPHARVFSQVLASLPGKVNLTTLFRDNPAGNIESVLGPAFMALVPTGKEPCGLYHFKQSCGAGDSCPRAHRLLGSPSAAVVEQAKGRLELVVSQYIANPPSKRPKN